MMLSQATELIDGAAALELRGTVTQVRGLAVHVADLAAPVGATVRIISRQGAGRLSEAPGMLGEVVGFGDERAIIMPWGSTGGVARGDRVIVDDFAQRVRVGEALLGRVLDGRGEPIDGGGPLEETTLRPLTPPGIDALSRPPIREPLATGVRAIDALLTLGRGQRIGIFAPPGLGKSTLLGMMARHTAADVSVIALVGERGREVRDFIENNLGPEGLARSVVVCATGDEPALLRIRAALAATTIAEYFRDQGKDVMLLMDSVTRFCQAQRQVGLAAGEPPATKGYPPSVFASLPILLERSGRTQRGSITGLYAVLVEGDDLSEPIADAARGVLDGHIQLSRALAGRGHWPAIDVSSSISRLAVEVTDAEQQAAQRQVLRLISDYAQVEDLLTINAYARGARPEIDLAIDCRKEIEAFLQQGRLEVKGQAGFEQARGQLMALMQGIESRRLKLAQAAGQSGRGALRPGS